jgi:hypothetical protein
LTANECKLILKAIAKRLKQCFAQHLQRLGSVFRNSAGVEIKGANEVTNRTETATLGRETAKGDTWHGYAVVKAIA